MYHRDGHMTPVPRRRTSPPRGETLNGVDLASPPQRETLNGVDLTSPPQGETLNGADLTSPPQGGNPEKKLDNRLLLCYNEIVNRGRHPSKKTEFTD